MTQRFNYTGEKSSITGLHPEMIISDYLPDVNEIYSEWFDKMISKGMDRNYFIPILIRASSIFLGINEEWKDIIDYEEIYQVSDFGRVRSLDRWVNNSLSKSGKVMLKGKLMPGHINQDGYVRITLSNQNKRKMIFAHVLSSTAFIENPNSLPEVNHKNGIKICNFINNLEWIDRSGNLTHAYKTGLRTHSYKGKTGDEHPKSKKVNQICVKTKEIINTFGSASEASRELGISNSLISKVCTSDKNKTGAGYIWEYANE